MTDEPTDYEPEPVMCDGNGECFEMERRIQDLKEKLEAAEAEILRLRRMRFPQVGDGQ